MAYRNRSVAALKAAARRDPTPRGMLTPTIRSPPIESPGA
jgi:hypothetical protein